MAANYNIPVTFEQILALVKALPKPEKVILSKELEKELVSSKLTGLLQSFKTDGLTEADIETEVESVRSELFNKRKRD